MDINEKLRRLTEGKNKAAIARSANLKPTQLNDYTNKGFKPRYDIAFRLARALSVAPEWLFNDETEWPPVSAAKSLSDAELMREMVRRQRDSDDRLEGALMYAEGVDWDSLPPDKISGLLSAVIPIVFAAGMLGRFRQDLMAAIESGEVDHAKKSRSLMERTKKLWERPGFLKAAVALLAQVPREELEKIESQLWHLSGDEGRRRLGPLSVTDMFKGWIAESSSLSAPPAASSGAPSENTPTPPAARSRQGETQTPPPPAKVFRKGRHIG